jgi:hypothetical protein
MINAAAAGATQVTIKAQFSATFRVVFGMPARGEAQPWAKIAPTARTPSGQPQLKCWHKKLSYT